MVIPSNEILTQLYKGPFATSNDTKRRLLAENGYQSIDDRVFIDAVTRGEDTPEIGLIVEDNSPDWHRVGEIAARKAFAVNPLVNWLFVNKGRVMPVWVHDGVFSFKKTSEEGISRVIVNKADTEERKEALLSIYDEQAGSRLYSKTAQIQTIPGNPINFILETSLRIGDFTGNPTDFNPSPTNSAGFTAPEAIENGLVLPDPNMKFEARTFDYTTSGIVIQRNYVRRVPFFPTEEGLQLVHQLSLGIMSPEFIKGLSLVPGKELQTHQRNGRRLIL